MNELQVFQYHDRELRTLQRDGEPWFVLKDVCKVLNMDTSKIKQVADRLDPDEKGRYQIPTPGGPQDTTIISESGLYAVILRSDKPEAKPFRKWVTSQVLPSIRKHGGYIAGQEGLPPDQLMAKALLVAQKTMDEQSAKLADLELENRRLLAAIPWGPPVRLWSQSELSYMLFYALSQGREDYITAIYMGYYLSLSPAECFALETAAAAFALQAEALTFPNRKAVPLNGILIQRFRRHLSEKPGARLLLRDGESLYEAVSTFHGFLSRYWPLASNRTFYGRGGARHGE